MAAGSKRRVGSWWLATALLAVGSAAGGCTTDFTRTGNNCGDGLIQDPETCDDANTASGDGCGASCQVEDGWSCTGEASVCESQCGDDMARGNEACDGGDLRSLTCSELGLGDGDLACGAGCVLDTSGCDLLSVCGNGTVEPSEDCDGDNLAGATCESLGLAIGTLRCTESCEFNVDECSVAATCGNGIIEYPELCDGADLGGNTCGTLGCQSGSLTCDAACTFDMAGCHAAHDEDADGIDDNCDNCPTYTNPGQQDVDGDGVGEACEAPGDAPLLSVIAAFESLESTSGIWTVFQGTWTPGVDEVTGSRINAGANYYHSMALPNVSYSVEATFRMDQPPVAGNNWTGVVFARTEQGGSYYAYECAYERGPHVLSIYRIAGAAWEAQSYEQIQTTVQDDQWHRMRAYRDGDTVRCTYDDETGASAQVEVSGADVWADMSGDVGLRVYNETTTFTSFVIYQ